jgi:hypothetical protein
VHRHSNWSADGGERCGDGLAVAVNFSGDFF